MFVDSLDTYFRRFEYRRRYAVTDDVRLGLASSYFFELENNRISFSFRSDTLFFLILY